MENTVKRCENCGGVCKISDTYCKHCSHSFNIESLNSHIEEPIIEGLDNKKVKEFIEKNNEYYVPKFKKAIGKERFIQRNFAALLYGPNWMFFRKMKREAITYVLVISLLCAFLQIIMPLIFRGTIDNFYETRNACVEYKETHTMTGYTQKYPAYKKLYNEYKSAKGDLFTLYLFTYIPSLAIGIYLRLRCNSLYKRHIIRNIEKGNGGISWGTWILGGIGCGIYMEVLNILLLLIPSSKTLYDAVSLSTLFF